ncbi:Co2+/Mg2+ efflux protein ApaG [Vibrio sp. MarTm2]|uniref:Protein ApaG n=2 Tax=Vibrio TaxID=662 RepID=A0ABR4YBE2_9VIBR|nr:MULTISPECIES: Co2+/Mg2+ efflux protein ApaG [Vibrio]EED24732.1 protein ApaG [Vibrio sp. 16]KHA60796.1 magnesium transporter ApaG [Vibrio variabilis]KHD25191.1 magnesium transporter ApaG [Vibrio caribbeanicus]KHT38495.1 magnesium transporter ApaG [Vibrio sinaloensis]KHT45613.1 magnesium transporter ApaG [Vibrio sinaloensis]
MEAVPCIKVQVHSKYIPEQSQPDANRYLFAYMITIKNLSNQTVQLQSRRWLITDANGKQLTIEGDGVVGQQPFIPSNDEYTYSSGTAIETPVGVMQGQYMMLDEKGNQFIAEIDPFRLAIPNILN